MRRIAAQYIFPITAAPLPMGVVTLDDNGRILEIGQLQSETESTEFYNGIIVPGFVNTHCHLELSHLKEVYTPHGGLADFVRQISSPQRYLTDENKRINAMIAADREMQQEGIVAVGDICNGGESFAVKQHSRLLYHSFVELAGLDEAMAVRKLQVAQQLTAIVQQMGLSASITPHAAYSMSDPLFEATIHAANMAGILSVHNQESDEENELFTTGTGALHQLFVRNGLVPPVTTGRHAIHSLLSTLSKETSAIFVHNVATTEDDYDQATAQLPNLTWTLCPNSNLQIEERLPPVDMFYRKKAQVAIGTDSLASNQRLSVMEELKTINQSFPQVPLPTLLQWATLNGAKALKIDEELGSLMVGKRPGLVLIENINFTNMQLTPDSRAKEI